MNKKKVILFIILIVIAFFVYNYFRTGQFTLFPVSSEADRVLKSLKEDFRNAEKSIAQAERSAGVSGLDTTSDVEAALSSIRRIERELEELDRNADSDEMKAKIQELKDEIGLFKKRYE